MEKVTKEGSRYYVFDDRETLIIHEVLSDALSACRKSGRRDQYVKNLEEVKQNLSNIL